MLFAADPWFRGIDLTYGPDGGVFLLDWSDTGECHDHDGVHRTSGRIYKVTYGDPRKAAVGDLSKLDERSLASLHRHPNEWFVRQARRVLADRAARGEPLTEAKKTLRALFDDDPDPVRKLRGLWSLYVIGGADDRWLRSLLDHPHESVRAWAIRLLTDEMPIDTIFSRRVQPDIDPSSDLYAKLEALAREDRSGLVRLVLASTLQRLPVARRVGLARPLVAHAEDAGDHNLPALIWTGLIPVADADPESLASLAADCRMPEMVGLIARRLGEDIESRPDALNALLVLADDRPPAFQSQVVSGLGAALSGWRKAKKPSAWEAFRGKLTADGRRGPSRPRPRTRRALRRRSRPGRGPAPGPGRQGGDRRAEVGPPDLDREPTPRLAIGLRTVAPRPVPERRRRARPRATGGLLGASFDKAFDLGEP